MEGTGTVAKAGTKQASGESQVLTRALLRGLAVIEALAGADEHGLGPSSIAEAVDLDKSTVTRLLRTLVEAHYVIQDPYSRQYRLTAKLLRMAHRAAGQLELRRVAEPFLKQLWTKLDETVHLGIMEDMAVVYLDKLESSNSIQLVSAVGQTMPLHSTALGKAMLAALPDSELEPILARLDFNPRTDRTIRNLSDFRGELERTRQRGYATDDRENEPLGACVAAAILDINGRPVGAISVAGPEFRIRDHFTDFGEAVRDAAATITSNLGHPT